MGNERPISPARGQAWQINGTHTLVYIMAVADGWALARIKGRTPFALFVKDLQTTYTRMESFDRDMGRPS